MLKYNTELCDFLKMPENARQSYSDVITQVYPLRADADRLARFCKDYLNGSPFQRFEPIGPWVIMQVLDYGKMSWKEESWNKEFADHRWFAQHELAFGIPVGCFDSDGFKELAMVYPFIFVDNALSMEGGRQLYGWSKAGISIERTLPQFEPNDPRRLVCITFRPAALEEPPKTSLEVLQKRPFMSGRSGIAAGIASVPRAVAGFLFGASGFLDTVGRLISKYQVPNEISASSVSAVAVQLQSLGRVLQQLFGYMNALVPTFFGMVLGLQDSSTTGGPETTIFTVKQVRDADEPKEACYRAIVRSKMKVEDVKDGGLLFDVLSGDPTGGIEINLNTNHKYIQDLTELLSPRRSTVKSTQPAKAVSQSAGATSQNPPLQTIEVSLEPVFPFWAKLNLSYGLADYQCWRTKRCSKWEQNPTDFKEITGQPGKSASAAAQSSKSTAAGPQASASVAATGRTAATATPPRQTTMEESINAVQIPYITRGSSGAELETSGPRDTSSAVLHCFMLKSDQKTLQKLIDLYLNNLAPDPSETINCFNFQVKGDFVYVALLSYDEMTIGEKKYRDDVLTFTVAVEYYSRLGPSRKPMGKAVRALLPLYTFVGHDWNFITEYEVYGRLTFKSTFIRPANIWIRESAPADREHEVLTLRTTLFPGESGEEGARNMPLVRIYSEPINQSTDASKYRSHDVPKQGGTYPDVGGLGEYFRIIAADQGHSAIALKQVRNAMDASRADYQSLVGVDRQFRTSSQINVLPAKIAIYKYPGFSIIEKLGLEDGIKEKDGSLDLSEFNVDSFSVVGNLHQEQGKELWRAEASGGWTKVGNGASVQTA